MAEWTQAQIKAAKGAVPFAWSEIEWEHFCDLAARGLAATEDAAKARALERLVAATRAYTEANAEAAHDQQVWLQRYKTDLSNASEAAFALCPEPTGETK